MNVFYALYSMVSFETAFVNHTLGGVINPLRPVDADPNPHSPDDALISATLTPIQI